MCIRDSTKIETETQLLRLLGNTPLQVDVEPVSYTHLDVYKRQAWTRFAFLAQFFILPFRLRLCRVSIL